MRKAPLVAFLLFTVVSTISAQTVVATLDITDKSGAIGAPGKPLFLGHVVRNTTLNEWLVIWLEARITKSRRINDDGTFGPGKILKRRDAILDVLYVPDHRVYWTLQTYRGDRDIIAQVYTEALTRKGTAKNLNRLFKPLQFGAPNALYNPLLQQIDIFAATSKVAPVEDFFYNIVTIRLDITGKPVSAPQTLITSAIGRGLVQLQATRNPATGNVLLSFKEEELTAVTGQLQLLGYIIKPDATIIQNKPLKFFSIANCQQMLPFSSAFSNQDGGAVFWSFIPCDNSFHQTRYKIVLPSEKKLKSQKVFGKGNTPTNNIQALKVIYNDVKNEYVIFWHEQTLLFHKPVLICARVNAQTGAIVGTPVEIATIQVDENGYVDKMDAAFDSESGKAFVAWGESFIDSIYQIRGAIVDLN